MFSAIKIMASAMFTLSMVYALPADAAVGAEAHTARSVQSGGAPAGRKPPTRGVAGRADWSRPPSVMVIGDSMSDSVTASGTWPATLAAQIGVPLVTVAKYSAGSKQVYRSGAKPLLLTLSGPILPAGKISVAIATINGAAPSADNPAAFLLTFDGDTSRAGNSVTGMFAGRHVTVSSSANGAYDYSVAADAGSTAVAVPAAALFVPDYARHFATSELLIWQSQNNFYSGNAPDHINHGVYDEIAAEVRRTRGQRILIFGLLPDASWLPGTPQYIAVRAFNAGLKARWPDHYVQDAQGRDPLARMLASGNGSEGDRADVAHGVTPRSLHRDNGGGAIDSLHLGPAGNAAIVALAAEYRRLQQPPTATANSK